MPADTFVEDGGEEGDEVEIDGEAADADADHADLAEPADVGDDA